jgi:hypothetical protein
MKNRIIETEQGFFPQFKVGLLWPWYFYAQHADKECGIQLVVWMRERDPLKAARFATETDARSFIDRVMHNAKQACDAEQQSNYRALVGVQKKRTINI